MSFSCIRHLAADTAPMDRTACGRWIDIVDNREWVRIRQDVGAYDVVFDPARVQCRMCKRTHAFQRAIDALKRAR